jgi:hypothetical protein
VSRTAWCSICIHAGLWLSDGDDIVPGSDSDGKGAGAAAQDSVGAIIAPLQGWDDAAMVHLDEGGVE